MIDENNEMDRQALLKDLRSYSSDFQEEEIHNSKLIELISNNDDAYLRSRAEGHVTASAWVTDPSKRKSLLLFHTKLQRWLQPGGHADGIENLIEVSFKELREETGLEGVSLHNNSIFDLDIHLIPSNKKDFQHYHFDVRYMFIGNADEEPNGNHESKEVRWIAWDRIPEMCGYEKSILRMLEKTQSLFS